ncbi:MAG: single-stranded DNA-binding protein [Candidatus Aminicenantes bacterium]|nr:single-stranded DNA-binding protein [Candidatus Aminicenantes bacterium]
MRDVNSLNKVILIGRLGGNPELRYLPQTERAVARFSLATNERYYNPDNPESEIRTEWHRITVWGKLAEFCEKYLNQGKQICLEGKLRTRSWQDKDGNKKYTTEIEAQSIVMLGRKDEGSGGGSYQERDTQDISSNKESIPDSEGEDGEDGEEVPF